jgi:hypothetical protein
MTNNNLTADDRIKSMFDLFGTPANALELKDFSVERAEEIAKELSRVGIRDGLLHIFGQKSQPVRTAYMTSATRLSDILGERLTDINTYIHIASLIAALDYVDIGKNVVQKKLKDPLLTERLSALDALVEGILANDCAPSLIRLIKRSREFDVPVQVFFESVSAVTYQEILDSVPPVEVADADAIIG